MFEPNGPTQLLSQKEVNDCLRCAFGALSSKDQANIEQAMAPLLKIPGMGMASALRLLFAVDRADDLTRLNQTLVKGE